MTKVLITHVAQHTGPGTLPVLLREKMVPVCHDASFEDVDTVQAFEKDHPGATAHRAQTPESLAAEIEERGVEIEAVISNDVYPNTRSPCKNDSFRFS